MAFAGSFAAVENVFQAHLGWQLVAADAIWAARDGDLDAASRAGEEGLAQRDRSTCSAGFGPTELNRFL